MRLTERVDGGPADVEPLDFPTNQGGLCRKGWTATELLASPERLTSPMLRRTRGGPLEAYEPVERSRSTGKRRASGGCTTPRPRL